jgi:sodium pump decarboxylase gamma subunit
MSLGEIVKTALIDTALGMGTVFAILILISIVIWLMGRTVGGVKPKKKRDAEAGSVAGDAVSTLPSVSKDGLTPEMIAAIATVAINQHLREQKQAAAADEYVVRNIRRANWRR